MTSVDSMTRPQRADHPLDSAPTTDELLLQAATAPIIGYRIMRETEIAPAWWGQRFEIGETVSATVAMNFCDEQNAKTMNPNRSMRQVYFAEPIFAPSGAVAA